MSATGVGKSVVRKEAYDKVTGRAKYTGDFLAAGILTARLVTSTLAHAEIKSIDFSGAAALPGVRAVVTGESLSVLCGPALEDRPPLAKKKVRYYGEPVAIIVADDERTAAEAAVLSKVEYSPIPVVSSPYQALSCGAHILHEDLGNYKLAARDVYPQPGSNICDRKQVRKGDVEKAFSECFETVEARFTLPQSDHIAMETRAAQAEIHPDGTVFIRSSSQSPFEIRKVISKAFGLVEGRVVVEVPFVGGAFGGKSPVQLELLAYLASRAVGGRPVGLVNSRENDIASSPCRMGLEATVKLGAAKDGKLKAARLTYLIDSGAYSDIGPKLASALIVDGTGPYRIDNVWCDALCVYTNHPYSTSFRGFGHVCSTFCIERAMDRLAKKLQIDPMKFRWINALVPGDHSPTQVKVTESNFGSLKACIEKLSSLAGWTEGQESRRDGEKIVAQGVSCFWKTSNSPPNATAGVFITFNADGSVNLNCGCTEIGPGMKTVMAQLLSEKLNMDISRIFVNMDVNTKYCPEHWKTVASMTTHMVGNAVLRAADDVLKQFIRLGAVVLKCPPENLAVGEEKVYLKSDPTVFLSFRDLVHGYEYPNGNSIEGQILGRGNFVMGDINYLDKETGKGKSGPYWTVGAQAVEIEYDPREYTYRLIKAATVIDAGKVLNPSMADAVIKGGVCMGLGLASREAFSYDPCGRVLDTSLRTYKVMHFGQTPQYLVGYVETPQLESPYGTRGIGEHGILGIPAAVANALSIAAGTELDTLPLEPEVIWRAKTGGIS